MHRSSLTRRSLLAGAVAAGAATAVGAAPASAAPGPPASAVKRAAVVSRNVHIFYYPWYGTPEFHGSWRHWQQGGLTPPEQLSSDFYPLLGAYDSGDVQGAVTRHMEWMRQAGTGVLVTSWWGRGSYEDRMAPGVLDAAAAADLKVAWHIEPYEGRDGASVAEDVRYLTDAYGGHPAFYRDAEHGDRGAYYVFHSLLTTDWSALDAVADEAIVLAQTWDLGAVAHFGGIYTYDAIATAERPDWTGAAAHCAQNGLVWAPSLGPGYVDDRAVPGNTTPTLERRDGATYDEVWEYVLTTGHEGTAPTWVGITSFNEWHEGTQIEPATHQPPAVLPYRTYDGAYGLTGAAAETAYLDRTAHWVERFEAARAAA